MVYVIQVMLTACEQDQDGVVLILLAVYQFYFWNKTLHVSDSSSVHHREFFAVHTTMVYVIQVMLTACEQDQPCSQCLKFIFRIKLYMFQTVPLSIIKSFSLYTQQRYMSYRFADRIMTEPVPS